MWLRRFQIIAVLMGISACSFDGEELRKYLPVEIAEAPVLYSERDILFCAVAIYQLPEGIEQDDLPLSEPDRSTSEWLELPLDGQVDVETSFATQALFNGDDCFESEAQQITGLSKLSDYYSSERTGFFIEVRHDLILVHDTTLDMIIISSRAR
ncbi:MAG: hypothetical protein AAGA71_22135 [Pseudomonadota bacterium]